MTTPEPEPLRLAELLGALSLTTDLGAGVPFEKGLRTCVVASALAEEAELAPRDAQAVYYAALLRSLGCTAQAPTFAAWFGDDVAIQRELKTLDLDDPEFGSRQRARFAQWAGAERAGALSDRFARDVREHGTDLARGSCEVTATLGARLGLPDGAVRALDEVYERWDGGGVPTGRGGEELTIAARIVHVAERAVMAHYEGEMTAEVNRRAGGQLDPALCATFTACAERIGGLLDGDVVTAALAAEPAPRRVVRDAETDQVCAAFATFADLKGRFLLGHATHVAELAGRAAELAGWDERGRRSLRRAALLLDLGRVGVSSAVWDRPAPLREGEWERVRLHAYWTERILRRCAGLAELAPDAGAHHERLDGSGYHRGAHAAELSAGARLLAAADVFAALTEPRPHRTPFAPDAAASALDDEVAAGRLDGAAAAEVIEAAGLRGRRAAWPCDLTDREVEVLRSLVRGASNREIADELSLSPRTIQHHLASVYDKIDLRTRAGAAVFAIEHGLVPAARNA